MKKRTVGIYARYDASEQSFCAAYLARYVTTCYRYARWIVPEAPKPRGPFDGFSHQWDRNVIPWHGKRKEAVKTARSCDTFFFFEPNEELFDRLPKDAVTAYFMDPHRRSGDSSTFAKRCTRPLVADSGSLKRFREMLPGAVVWPFDPAIQCFPRNDLDFDRSPSLLFPAFGLSPADRKFVEDVAEIVKLCMPNVKTAVTYYDATVPARPGVDSRTHDWRLIRYLQSVDWIVDLNPQPLYGLFPAYAGGFGLQWIGFELPPNTDARNAARRHLIRMPVRRNDSGSALMPDLESVARQIVLRLGTPFHNDGERHAGAGAWDHRRAEFLRVTNTVLGIKTRY